MSHLLKGKTVFSSLDYTKILAEAGIADLVYMDPPYQGLCGDRDSRYLSGISFSNFVSALEDLNSRGIPYMVSYDGRRGNRAFGELLPSSLDLTRVELEAGRSSQATLLGRDEITYESLYLSRALTEKLVHKPTDHHRPREKQYVLLEPGAHYVSLPLMNLKWMNETCKSTIASPTKSEATAKVMNSIQMILCSFAVQQTERNRGLANIASIVTMSRIERFV